MSWYYRIRKRIINGKPWYDIVEYVVQGKSRGWTHDGMAPGGESREEVIRCLEMMLKDARRRNAFFDKND